MPTPSLLIVPARFKTGKLYSQIPTSGAGDFTVTRNTAARRFDSAGLVASVASGIPRLDYYTSGGTAGCPALLVEPAATNLCLQSAGFQVSGTWVPENATITTGTTSAFTAPDGSTDADLLTDDAINGKHRVSQGSLSFTSGTTYAFSVFVKKNSSGRFLLLNANTAFGARAALNLDTLAITNINGSGASVEDYGNGWYRFLIRGTATSTQTTSVLIQMQDAASDANYIGNGSSFYLWGAQLETGSVATSYIPTTTGSVTRNADVLAVSGAVSGSIGQTEGTIYAEVDIRNMAKETYLIRIDDGATANVITLRTLTSNVIRTAITALTTSGTINISSAAFTAGIVKIAFAYKSGEIALSVNGATALTANGTFVFSASLNRITLGSNVSGGELNDRIRAAALYTTRLTNAELAALTNP